MASFLVDCQRRHETTAGSCHSLVTWRFYSKHTT